MFFEGLEIHPAIRQRWSYDPERNMNSCRHNSFKGLDFPSILPEDNTSHNHDKMAASMTRKEILGKVYKMVPPMLEKFHKGMHETTKISHWPC